MSDFKKSSNAPQKRDATARPPHDQGGEPTTGFIQAPKTSEELGNFSQGPGVPPSHHKIR